MKPVLNIGCGGPTSKRAFYGDIRVDIREFPNVTAVMDAHKLAFRDNSFRKIVAYEVLEHLESPIEALREMKRVLSDGGILEITIPNVWYWRLLLACWLGTLRPKNLDTDHKQIWDIYTFQLLAKQVGLDCYEIKWLDWYGFPKSRKYGRIEPIVGMFLPRHLRHTHVLFRLKKL
ncbi:MAG: methyltransferase domain-containing protein [Candidatus Methanodesulfokora sp.]